MAFSAARSSRTCTRCCPRKRTQHPGRGHQSAAPEVASGCSGCCTNRQAREITVRTKWTGPTCRWPKLLMPNADKFSSDISMRISPSTSFSITICLHRTATFNFQNCDLKRRAAARTCNCQPCFQTCSDMSPKILKHPGPSNLAVFTTFDNQLPNGQQIDTNALESTKAAAGDNEGDPCPYIMSIILAQTHHQLLHY